MINQKFTTTPSAIASYNYTDIISGTGYIALYISKTTDKYVLSNNVFYASTVCSQVYNTTTTNPAAKVADLDFDVLVNKPLDIKGTAIVQVSVKITHTGSSGGSYEPYIIAKFRKWDGSSETDIVQNQSKTFYVASNGDQGWGNGICYDLDAIDLSIPLTHFKKGEYIRITLELWGYCDASAPGSIRLGWDPKNRSVYKNDWDTSAKSSPSVSILQLPIKLTDL